MMKGRRALLAKVGSISATGGLVVTAGCTSGDETDNESNESSPDDANTSATSTNNSSEGGEAETIDDGESDEMTPERTDAEDGGETEPADGADAADDRETRTPDGSDTANDGNRPDFGGYFDGNVDVVSRRGESTTTVSVGAGRKGLSFDPKVIHVDSGTTVRWEWTGNGDNHNVVAEDGSFSSGAPVAGSDITFEHTFVEDGVNNYICEPHSSLAMKGSVVVGSNYPTR